MKKNTFLKHVAAKNSHLGTVRYLVQKCKVIITEKIKRLSRTKVSHPELCAEQKTSKIKTPSAKKLSEQPIFY